MRSAEFYLNKLWRIARGEGEDGEGGISVRSSLGRTGTHGNSASLSSVVTIPIPSDAALVCMQAETQNVRYTLDGTNPVASTTGFVLAANGDPLYVPVNSSMTLKVIQAAATARLQYQFFREQ